MVYRSDHPPFAVTADIVALAHDDAELLVLLVTRASEPYADQLALPGGFVDPDEDLGDAARRELAEETGVSVSPADLVQIGAYGRPDRDPRMRTVSVAYRVQLASPVTATGGDDASDAQWHPVDQILGQPGQLAFDHEQIIRDALDSAWP